MKLYIKSIAVLLVIIGSTVKCSKEQEKQPQFFGKVIIVGAGAAGLYAGHELEKRGVEFEILEATDRYGGRMGEILDFASFPIDMGAQWLHGKKSIAGDLVNNSGTQITLDDGDMNYWFEGSLTESLPNSVEIFEGDNKPDISYEDYATQQGLDSKYKYIVEGIAGDQGADASELSVYYNNKEEEEWNSGEEDYKFKNSFFSLIKEQVAATVSSKIKLNTVVKSIDYSGSEVVITDQNGNSYDCDKVIVTVPITILQDGDITFIPALSSVKTTAFDKISMGPGMKVFLKFSSKFYDENIMGGEVCAAYADESVGKSGSDNVLLAFVMGEQAQALTNLGSDEAITTKLIEELDLMYNGQASSSFQKSKVIDWTSSPYIRGAYSHSTVGMGYARAHAAASIGNKVFFAGEAMNLLGHHQTVHGAMESAKNEVEKILYTED